MKKTLAFILTLALVLTTSIGISAAIPQYGSEYANQPTKQYTQIFKDVPPSHWAFSYIGEMAEREILSGYPNGYFYPSNTITRAEFSKVMCLASGLTVNKVYMTSYDDVSVTDWFAPYIECGKYYLSGYVSNGKKLYKPNDKALREDIAVALVKLKGYETSLADESILKAMFTDYQSISADARKYVAIAVEKGLVSGYEDNTFRGQDTLTRAEASTLLWRAYQFGNANKVFDSTESETAAKADEPKQTEPEVKEEITKEEVKEVKEENTKTENVKEEEPSLPYVCDTLASATVGDTFLASTMDKSDNLYYYDKNDDTIYKISLKDGKKTSFFDISDFEYEDIEITEKEVEKQVPKTVKKTVEKEIEIDEEEPEEDNEITPPDSDSTEEGEEGDEENEEEEEKKSEKKTKIVTEEIEETIYETVTETVEEKTVKGVYKKFYFEQIYYNTGDNNLYLIGSFTKYKTDNSLNGEYASYETIFKINNGKAVFANEVKFKDYRDDYEYIIGNCSNGDFIAEGRYYDFSYTGANYVFNISDMNYRRIGSSGSYIAYEAKGTIYSLSPSTRREATLSKYDFSNGKTVKLTSAESRFIAVNNGIAYFWNPENGTIAKSDTSGKIEYVDGINTKTGVEVLDFKDMPKSCYIDKDSKFYVTDKYGYVFYDKDNKSWRVIKKRK